MRSLFTAAPRRGGIVVDTLIVLVVIGLLVAVAIPVYSGKNSQSKLDAARREVEQLAAAEATAAKSTGYYVPFQMLDDMPVREGARTDRTDDIGNASSGIRLIVPGTPAEEQIGKQAGLDALSAGKVKWDGPFFESKRVFTGAAGNAFDGTKLDGPAIRRDYPLDPWGQPYRLYSAAGIVGTGATKTAAEDLAKDEFSDGVLTKDDPRFDRYAVVSYGADGKSDSISQGNDDIIYFFGPEAAPKK